MKTVIYFNILFIFCVETLLARFATEQDMSATCSYINNNVKIDKNYKVNWITEEQINIIDENARDNYKLIKLLYTESFESFNVINASIDNDKKYEIDKNLIEDKTLASEANRFINMRQILIPFKKIQAGSKINLKYERVVERQLVDNHFSKTLYYGTDILLKNSKTIINSEIPLYIFANDPFNVLEIKEFKKNNIYHYTIKLLKPISSATINEPNNSLLSLENQTWVGISTDKTYESLNKTLANKYENIVSQTLPNELVIELKKFSHLTNDVDIINSVTNLVQNKVTYLRDWKKIEAGFYPRSMNEVIDTGYGDCKDYSLLTVASLRYLGLSAKFALVARGEIIQEHPNHTLASINDFNHVIVYVEGSNKKKYWIDPTNNISMAGGLFPDIANRKALVLTLDHEPNYMRVYNINYRKSKIHSKSEYKIREKNIHTITYVTFEKESAIMFTGSELFANKNIIIDYIYSNFLEPEHNIPKDQRLKSVIPDLNSRIVKNINFSFEYIVDNPYIETNMGKVLKLSMYDFVDPPEDSVNDIYIGQPRTYIKEYIFDIEISGIDKLNSNISTPWLDLSRKCYINKNGESVIKENYIFKKSFITFKDRQLEEYKFLKKRIKSFRNIFLVLK
ncbi:DUF3857 domain-containing protein [Francisella uliginis]|uniref:Transglutaminase n=1 Tax=Francisella uliginis TaxID=573570 RepID=A0A1L4BSH7_9GAMM|nr:DUF3857 domain-containing protein [Francisella uliginis]API86802.1 transglutaminase [Francisella uliginis]